MRRIPGFDSTWGLGLPNGSLDRIERKVLQRKNGGQGNHELAAGRGKHEYFDIVGELPLELVIHVVEYLDGADIVRSQRVRSHIHMSRRDCH